MAVQRLSRYAALVAISAASCAEPSAPARVLEARYVAVSIDGTALPAELMSSGTSHFVLGAMTITVESGAQATRVMTTWKTDDTNRIAVIPTTDTTQFDVRVSGDTTVFLPRCQVPFASCIVPIEMVRAGAIYKIVVSYDPRHLVELAKR